MGNRESVALSSMRAIADANIEDREGEVGEGGEKVREAISDRDLRRSSIQLSSRDSSVWHSTDDVSRIGVVGGTVGGGLWGVPSDPDALVFL